MANQDAVQRYHNAVKGSFHAQDQCKVCGRTIRTYGAPVAVCSNCEVKRKPWTPNGSSQNDYGEW